MDLEGKTRAKLPSERRDHGCVGPAVALTGAVHVEVPQRQHAQPSARHGGSRQALPLQLLLAIGRERRRRIILVLRARRRVAVDRRRAGECDALHTCSSGGSEHVARPCDVDREGLPRVAHGLRDTDPGRKVGDASAPFDGLRDRTGIADVPLDQGHARQTGNPFGMSGGQIVQHTHPPARCRERTHEVVPDESGAPGDEDATLARLRGQGGSRGMETLRTATSSRRMTLPAKGRPCRAAGQSGCCALSGPVSGPSPRGGLGDREEPAPSDTPHRERAGALVPPHRPR